MNVDAILLHRITDSLNIAIIVRLPLLVVDDLLEGSLRLILDGEPVLGNADGDAQILRVPLGYVVEEFAETPRHCENPILQRLLRNVW